MKSLALISLISFSFFTFAASASPSGLAEIHWVPICSSCGADSEHTSKIVSTTDLKVERNDGKNYVLKASTGTVWQADAQLENVNQVIMTYLGTASDGDLSYQLTVIQVDGNSMGASKLAVTANCENISDTLYCNGSLGNQSWLSLSVSLSNQ